MATSISSLDIDLEQLKRDKEKNFEERLKFIDQYAEWLKKTPNAVWSKQQNILLGKKN